MARTPKHVWAVDTEGPTTLDYALAYAKLGWYVLPVWSVDKDGECRCGHPSTEAGHKPGKHPQADLAPHGHHDSTINEDIIKNWWATDPNAGIGISMSQSGLIALDIDPQNDGQESLLQIEKEHGVLHSDCVAKTQGGGEHRIFTTEADVTYPGILGKGLDLKHHGYICVAPTLGVSGDYKWKRSPLSKSNPALPSSLPAFIKSKARSATEFSLIEHNGVPVATAQTFDDLRSALQHVDADDYTTWVNVATVLKPYGENGYRVWTDWSSKSDKFDAALQRKKWERDISQPHSITYRSIFKMAIDNGWVNTPIQTTPVNLEDHPLGLGRALPSGASEVTVFEYIFDGFMSTGVNVLAGAPGVGKTTLIVPLALSTAHLCHPEFELKPLVKRNVIIITESVVQVQRVIYSICKWGTTGLLSKDFDERVKVLQAYRLDPQIVAQVAEDYKEWTVNNEMEDGSIYKALPLVVFDTANAIFDLENENDNAQVGRAMAHIKQAFLSFPIIIVSHTAKMLGSGESDYLSPRGASAWTGDAHGVYTVFKDGEENDSPRVLKATKVRFPPTYPELGFDVIAHKEVHKNVLGYDSEIWFMHSTARKLGLGERKEIKETFKAEKENEQWDTIKQDLLNLIRKDEHRSRSYYERKAVADGGIKASQERKERAIDVLIQDGQLELLPYDKPRGRATHYLQVIEIEEKGKYSVN